MKRWWGLLLWLVVTSSFAAGRDIRLLENRFRIDSTITQVAFVIYRQTPSQPVVLIRPDGTKFYAWRHPDHVSWHKEPDMDIISIENPMPGPWQAIGKITPENKIRILSDLNMKVDSFPERMYQGETIKFTARLMQGMNPLNLRDFLDRVELNVTFTEFIDNIDDMPEDQRPQTKSIGNFSDDGRGLDEKPGDGVFTVELPIKVSPGKYRARVTSGNGVFFRALEQTVLVYPTPLMATLNQSRKKAEAHQLIIDSDSASIEPGSIATHAEFVDNIEKKSIYQGHAAEEDIQLVVDIDNFDRPGRHRWYAWLYATDRLSGRPLVFALPEQTFAVTDYAALDLAEKDREAREEAKRKREEARMLAAEKEAARKQALITIIGGNILVVVLVLIGWLVIRKIKAKKLADEAEPELEAPPPDEDKAA